ncbi:uncharacterized protein [Linepithema humile]|uniref:uncharacterized protein n=1 Tax=Linepithema humile TaxID=83485 RepID=UPI00351E7EDF
MYVRKSIASHCHGVIQKVQTFESLELKEKTIENLTMNVIQQLVWTIICMLLISGTVMHNTSNNTKNETYNENVQNISTIQNTTSTETSKKFSNVEIVLIICGPLVLIPLYAISICIKECEDQQHENQQQENQQDENQQDENQQDQNQQDENQQDEFLPDLFAMLPLGNVENHDDNAAVAG